MKKINVAFVWENFGPMHLDKLAALEASKKFSSIVGIEIYAKSAIYDWDSKESGSLKRITINDGSHGRIFNFLSIVSTSIKVKANYLFFCHYERAEIFAAALFLRLLGKKVFVMNDSKFDDYERFLTKENLKRVFYWPYVGAIAASDRSAAYMKFLGVRNIERGYDTLSVERLLREASSELHSADETVSFESRKFVCIARFVKKKNHALLLDAYFLYKTKYCGARKLVLCGGGPFKADIVEHARRLGIEQDIEVYDFLPSHEIMKIISRACALILPSSEEQFGYAALESVVLGTPVIVSDACGVRDNFVRSAVNGFVVEHDNAEGFAFFMDVLSCNEVLWNKLSSGTASYVRLADVREFCESVKRLTGGDC